MSEITKDEAIAIYRAQRGKYLAAQELADAAWDRWFLKRQAGQKTNGAAASRLSNEANWQSTLLAQSQLDLYKFEIDPADIDKEDGVDHIVSY